MKNLILPIETGTVVGTVHVEKPIDHQVTCEYAAWGHIIRGCTGRFPLKVHNINKAAGYSGLNAVRFTAEIPGVITSSDYASRFGGVAVGSGGINEMVGKEESFTYSWTVESIFKDHHILITPEFSRVIIETVIDFLVYAVEDFHSSLDTLRGLLTTPCGNDGVIGQFEGKYDRFQAGHAAWAAEGMAKALRLLETVQHPGITSRPTTINEIVEGWGKQWAKRVPLWDSNDKYNLSVA